MPAAVLVERALGPVDALRLLAFRLALRSRTLSSLVVRRSNRLAAQLALHAAVAFSLSIFYPVLLFVLAPVLLGVVHVAADVRYLVLRPKLEAWWRRSIVGGCLLFLGLHAFTLLHWLRATDRTELGLVTLWALSGVGAGCLRSQAWKRAALAMALVLATGAVALHWPRAFRLVFMHAHNLVALAIWPRFYRQRPKALLLTMVPILAAASLLASGAFYRSSLAASGVEAFGIHVLQVSMWVAPFARIDFAMGLTSAFVFLQAIHYAIWLTVIPQAALPGQGTLSFRRSARSIFGDFGGMGTMLVGVAALAILVGACFNPPRASATYLSLAMFHGYLELVLLLYWWVSGERLRTLPDGVKDAQ